MKSLDPNNLSNGIIYTLLGFILLTSPIFSINIVAFAVGITKVITSAYRMYTLNKNGEQNSVAFNMAVLNLIFGLALLLALPLIIAIVPIALGIWVTSTGLNQTLNSFKYKEITSKWVLYLAFGIILTALGLYCVFNPINMIGNVLQIIGFFLLLKGFFLIYNYIKEGKNENPDVID